MRNRTLLRMLEREREHHAMERARLIDTICHLAGNAWTPAPADLLDYPEEPETVPALVMPDHWPDE